MAKLKKFSDIDKTRKSTEVVKPQSYENIEQERPAMPNLPLKTTKTERTITQEPISNTDVLDTNVNKGNTSIEKKRVVETYGKVARFPKNVKASNAYNFLENTKMSKSSIWYILVEKEDNELQMVKYNRNEGVDLKKFTEDLKKFYIDNIEDTKYISLIESIYVDGTDKFSMIRNIPEIEVNGKKMISKITEDLIKLLSN